GPGRMGLDDVAGLAQRVRQRRRVEVAPPLSLTGINLEARVRPAGVEPQLDDLAVGIEILVQTHLFPVEYAEVVDGGVILAAEREITVAHGLEQHARNPVSLAVEHLDERVEPGLGPGRVDLENP